MQHSLNKELYFNAIESAKKLEASGFSREQAETQTRILGNVLSIISNNTVSKQDINLLEERLKRQFEEKIHALSLKITESEGRIIKVVVSVLGITTAMLALLIACLR